MSLSVSVDSNLSGLAAKFKALSAFKQYPVSEVPSLKGYRQVPWDGCAVEAVSAGKNLYTREVTACVVLCTKGYNAKGELTHIGMAHMFMNEKLPSTLFAKMREQVGRTGRVAAFVGGGSVSRVAGWGPAPAELAPERKRAIAGAAKAHSVVIQDDKFGMFHKRLGFKTQKKMHFGWISVSHVWFNEQHRPQLRVVVDEDNDCLEELEIIAIT